MLSFDSDSVLNGIFALFGGSGMLAVGWSATRKKIARDSVAVDEARSESNRIRRREDELAEKQLEIKVLTEAIRACDERVVELRLKVIALDEQDKRRRSHVRHLQSRLRRLDPGADVDDWMSSDHSPLGPPEID